MKFAATTLSVTEFGQDTLSFTDALAIIRGCGFDRVMLISRPGGPILRRGETPNGVMIDLAESDLDIVAGQLQRAGLAAEIVFGAGVNLSTADDIRESRQWLLAMVRAARHLGCRHVGHPCPGARASGMAVADKADDIRRLADLIGSVSSEAPDLHFGVDVHYHAIIESVDDCEYYLEQLPSTNAGILVNTGHLTTAGQPGWELCERHPDRTPIIGWKDHLTGPDLPRPVHSVQLGTGHTPLEKYIRVIKPQVTDRAHCITIEHVPEDQRTSVLSASREYLEDLWDHV